MATRSVGEIEVTVVGDTSRLKAQLKKDGTVAGKELATAINKEIRNLEANLREIDGRKEARLLRLQIENILRGIEVKDVDVKQASAKLAEWREAEEVHEIVMGLALEDRDLAEIAAKVEKFTDKQWSILLDAKVDLDPLDVELAKREAEQRLKGIEAEIDLGLEDAAARRKAREWEQRRIKVRIDAEVDLHKATVALEKFEAEQHRIEIGMDLDLTEVNRKFREAKIATEAERWDITTRLRTGTFQADLERIRREEQAEAWKIALEFQTADANRQIAEMEAIVESRDMAANLTLDTARARAEMSAWRVEQSRNPIEVPLDPELAAASAAFSGWIQRQQAKGIDVNVDPDTVRATIEFEAWILRMQAKKIDVPIDVDKASAVSAGTKAGEGFGSGWSSWLFDNQKLITAAVGLLGPDIAVALQGALSAATAVVSSAFSAIGGAIGGAIPIIAGLAPVIGAGVIGFQGMGDALGAVRDEFKEATAAGREFNINAEGIQSALAGLAPAAQDTVIAFAGLQDQFGAIQQSVQGELFAGMGQVLRNLSATAIPSIGEAFTSAADSLNGFMKNIAGVAEGIDFAGLFEGVKPAIDDVGDAIVAVFETFEPFIEAATPAALQLAESLKKSAESLRDMVSAGAESGELRDFFTEGVESLRTWWELIRNTGDALFTLFQAGKESGDGFVQSLADIIGRFDSWMESAEGQTALTAFFEGGERTMKALVPVLEGLKGLFQNLVTPESIGRFEALADSVGRLLPVLGQVLDVVGRVGVVSTFVEALARIGEALQPAIPALQELADALGTILMGAIDALTPLVEGLGPILGQVAEALTPLAAPIVEIAQHLVEMVTPELLDFLQAFADALTELSPIATDLLEAFLPFVDVAVIPLIAALQIATPLLQMLADAFEALAPLVEALKGPLEIVAGIFKAIHAPLTLLASGLKNAGLSFGDLSNPAGAAAKVMEGAFTPALEATFDNTALLAAEEDRLTAATERVQAAIAGAMVIQALADAINATKTGAEGAVGGMAQMTSGMQNFDTSAQNATTSAQNAALEFGSVAEQAKAAGEAATKMSEAFDILVGRDLSAQEAADNYRQSIADLREALLGGTEATSLREEAMKAATDGDEAAATAALEQADALAKQAGALKNTSKAGREAREALRQTVEQMITMGTASVTNQKDIGRVTQRLMGQRETLISMLTPLRGSREAAIKYVNSLGLTPKNIRTAVRQTGMEKAREHARGYKGDLDRVPRNKQTRFDTPGAEKAREVVGGLMTSIGKVQKKAETKFDTPGSDKAKSAAGDVKGAVDKVPKTQRTDYKTPGADAAKQAAKNVEEAVRGVPTSKSVTISANTAVAINNVNNLVNAIARVQSKTVTITTVAAGKPPGQHGGQAPAGGMLIGEAGGEFFRLGSYRGFAASPTVVPAGTMVTSAALTQALLNSGQQSGTVINRQINQQITVQPLSADPTAVAVQVMNRAAALAGV